MSNELSVCENTFIEYHSRILTMANAIMQATTPDSVSDGVAVDVCNYVMILKESLNMTEAMFYDVYSQADKVLDDAQKSQPIGT